MCNGISGEEKTCLFFIFQFNDNLTTYSKHKRAIKKSYNIKNILIQNVILIQFIDRISVLNSLLSPYWSYSLVSPFIYGVNVLNKLKGKVGGKSRLVNVTTF